MTQFCGFCAVALFAFDAPVYANECAELLNAIDTCTPNVVSEKILGMIPAGQTNGMFNLQRGALEGPPCLAPCAVQVRMCDQTNAPTLQMIGIYPNLAVRVFRDCSTGCVYGITSQVVWTCNPDKDKVINQ